MTQCTWDVVMSLHVNNDPGGVINLRRHAVNMIRPPTILQRGDGMFENFIVRSAMYDAQREVWFVGFTSDVRERTEQEVRDLGVRLFIDQGFVPVGDPLDVQVRRLFSGHE